LTNPAFDGFFSADFACDTFGLNLELFFDSPTDFGPGFYTGWDRKATLTYLYIEIPRASAVIP
jgi:hypothetical protein